MKQILRHSQSNEIFREIDILKMRNFECFLLERHEGYCITPEKKKIEASSFVFT